jgi:diguanylate cyclase (GGDEF)-like protein
VNPGVIDAERLSAALLAIEDEHLWDAFAALATATEIEQQAARLGDEMLVHRARLCVANMQMRCGDLAGAARLMWEIQQWAVDHDATQLRARVHLVWANIHRLLGDAAQCLEHSVLSVELLDGKATTHMQIWHRAKLADALGLTGSMDAARLRYAQTEDLCEIENGRFAEAERTLLECIRRHGDGRHEDADALAEYLLTLARAQRGLGATDRAQASLDASRALCVERDLGDVLVRVHQEQAELHAVRGEYAEAFAVHKVFFAAYHKLHSRQREAQARTRQAMFETVEARQEAERFREQARRDPLTGLRNRRYVDEQLPGLIEHDPELTLAIVDLDHFKRVNDLLSHDVGDQVLVQVAKLLETELAAVCRGGFASRLGGEEFLLVLPRTQIAEATARLEGIRRAVSSFDWTEMTHGVPVTVSIGVVGRAESPVATQPALLSIADRNLYAAKHGGRNQVVSSVTGVVRRRSFHGRAPAA